jgi:hypothetical protein
MVKKLKSSSQYYPELSLVDSLVTFHSQLGDDYKIAELGCVDELYDRLAKYDIPDIPLNRKVAIDAISHFLSPIQPFKCITKREAYGLMDLSKSVGFGASSKKIYTREDERMYQYMKDYAKLTSEQIHHVIINAAQKDEVRVSSKTPRLFTSFPPEHTFLCLIVLCRFMDQFQNHSFCKDGSISTVGDSIQDGAVKHYYNVLNKRPYKYCTDTSGQDSSVSGEFLDLFYSMLETKIDFDCEEERAWYRSIVFNSKNKLLNVNGDLYLVRRGLGSGDYLTIVINIIWRFYMFVENYNHKYEDILRDNTLAICGDDFICSSQFNDLDLNSKYAKIEWAGKPVEWDDMDFCSLKFVPYIHHDPVKVKAVLEMRKKKVHMLSPKLEMQRLGGLLRVLADYKTYQRILAIMVRLVEDHPETRDDYDSLFISYNDLWNSYNLYIERHSRVLKPSRALIKMSTDKKKVVVIRKGELEKLKNKANQNKKTRTRRKGKPNPGFVGNPVRDMPFTAFTGAQNKRSMTKKNVQFSENLGTINTAGASFNVTQYPINPGQSSTFPWLYKEAAQWEKYRIRKLMLQFIPSVTEFSANGIGSIGLAFDSDASDTPPSNWRELYDMEPASFNLPCKVCVLNVPYKIMNTLTDGFFIRRGLKPIHTDIKTYDCGNLFVATEGQASAGMIGQLVIHYDVEFLIPVLDTSPTPPVNNTVSYFKGTSTTLNAEPTQLAFATNCTDGLGIYSADGSFILPQGNYLVDVMLSGTASTGQITGVYFQTQKDGTYVNEQCCSNQIAIIAAEPPQNLKKSVIKSPGVDEVGTFSQLPITGSTWIQSTGTNILTLVGSIEVNEAPFTGEVFYSIRVVSI